MSIIDPYKLREDVIKLRNTEVQTYSVKFFDEYYTPILGNCTDITGYPYMGKTLVVMEILKQLTDLHGWRHVLHLPDAGKPEEVVAMMIHKRTGKTFDRKYPNLITEKEVEDAFDWFASYFDIYNPIKDGKVYRPTPIEFWEFCASQVHETGTIDSWNYMNHGGQITTQYLAEVLSHRNTVAEQSAKHFFTLIHPKNPTAKDYDDNGQLRPADPYSMMGGSEWNNNGKNIMSIHKESREGSVYDINFWKIKPRIVGKSGKMFLNYDIPSAQFHNNEFPLSLEKKLPSALPVNKGFEENNDAPW